MRKIIATSLLLLCTVTVLAQQRVKITVQAADSTNTYIVTDEAKVFFEPYFDDLPDSIQIVDMGYGVSWASINYSRGNSYGFHKQFEWPTRNFVGEDWGTRYGQKWRIPTVADFEVLRDSCEWVFVDGGFKVTSPKTQQSLFLPFDGKNDGDKEGRVGYYWTTDVEGSQGSYFQISFDDALEQNNLLFKNEDKLDRMSIRPVFGEPISRVKVYAEGTTKDYQSVIVSVSAENVELSDIIECGIYYSSNQSLLPTNEKPNTSLKPVSAQVGEDLPLNQLISGRTYYFCAYVITAKGTTYSEPIEVTVLPMTVAVEAKEVADVYAVVTLDMQAYPLANISEYGVVLNDSIVSVSGAPEHQVVDLEITNLSATTDYSCSPYAVFDGKRYEGYAISFTTEELRPVNVDFPVPTRMIDLKLPSGLLWAPYNIGDNEETTADWKFYGWGDPTGKAAATGNNVAYANGEQAPGPEGDEMNVAGTQYDIATVQWGGQWHMPSKADFYELFNNCTVTEENRNGLLGLVFSNARTTETLWLPLPGGMSWNGTVTNKGTDGYYWTSETSLSKDAYRLRLQKAIDEKNFELKPRGTRGCIRPVYGEIKHSGNVNPGTIDPPQPGEDGTVTVAGYDTETAEGAETAYPKSAVDLGLPSGTRWATWNIGAMEYGDLGKYYAWGELKSKETFTKENYNTDSVKVLFSQCYNLPDTLDAAKMLWDKGGHWLMPDDADYAELFTVDPNNSDSLLYVSVRWETDETHGDCFGMRVISRQNGNSIFFPAAGDKSVSVMNFDRYGYYWTCSGSSLNGKRQSHALCFEFGLDSSSPDGMFHQTYNLERFDGCMIRPIWKANPTSRRSIPVEFLEMDEE